MPAAVTVIDEVVAPVLQLNEPIAAVDNTELPQLLLTLTRGADGIAIGDAAAVPAGLVQPLTVVVTE